jgi:hypothetical protein
MAAHNWRTLRQQGLGNGIGDLMALSSMHVVLDMIESVGIESTIQGATSESEAKAAIGSFYDKLYKPDLREAMRLNAPEPVPAGFEDDEVEASFDAFMATMKSG